MMQYRLSTLLLAFVVVWASLAVFGAVGGIIVAVFLLVAAAYIRGAESRVPIVIFAIFGVSCGLCLLGLLLPAVQFVVGNYNIDAKRQSWCVHNLEEIGVALRNYENCNGRFPPAVFTDKQGRAMHSWRALVTPFGNRDATYRWDEPWNGPNNNKWAEESECAFRCFSNSRTFGLPTTSYLAVTGPGTVWDDRRSSTERPRLIVVEVANSGVQIAEPRDLTVDEVCRGVGDGAKPGTSTNHRISGGFFFNDVAGAFALRSDGRIEIIPADMPPKVLAGLFTGDDKAWRTFEQCRHQRVNWTNCTALAVLILSYAVLLFRPRDKLPPQTEPAIPGPPTAADGNGSGR